ncbi:CAP domain-containing protein [Candidatus Parcubacteria bacterium]|nr:hypothetical protein [Patescibacteria group bacterium]MBU4309181.1 hypothetical protein [Patescibacteria group bacterium]MBU4577542.1 hypothetical protein [Patescibacteria group bacterium]MCG2697229.1 CAP domain-containing protein [Candidatus Parcubacteria bacterium]
MKKPSLKKINIDYFLTYPLIFIILGIFLLPKLAFLSSITEQNIINLTNKERVSLSIPALTTNELLTKAAYAKAKSIVESQTFQHDIGDKRFSSWIKGVDYKYTYVGENLALDFTTSEGTIKAWLNSPSHKKNLLNDKFKETGVAVIEDKFQGKSTTIIVQIFGTPVTPLVNEIITPESKTNDIVAKVDNNINKNISLNPVKYKPNLFESSLDIVYNKKISAIILLNFVTILLLTVAFASHKIIKSHKKTS